MRQGDEAADHLGAADGGHGEEDGGLVAGEIGAGSGDWFGSGGFGGGGIEADLQTSASEGQTTGRASRFLRESRERVTANSAMRIAQKMADATNFSMLGLFRLK